MAARSDRTPSESTGAKVEVSGGAQKRSVGGDCGFFLNGPRGHLGSTPLNGNESVGEVVRYRFAHLSLSQRRVYGRRRRLITTDAVGRTYVRATLCM